MKKIFILFIAIGFVLMGCNQDVINGDAGKSNSTKDRVYSNLWDGNPIIVKQRNNNGDYKTVNEISDNDKVKTLIEALGNAGWLENVAVDIYPPDYRFTWNSYKHSVWLNQEFERLELIIEGESSYGTLSKESSEIVFEILTGKKFKHAIWENQSIKGKDFTKMTIYMNWDKEGPYVITEKEVINKVINKINSSPKEDISEIEFEQGPDGRIIFEGKKTVYEVKVFSFGGNVVTDKYLINTGFNFEEIITKE